MAAQVLTATRERHGFGPVRRALQSRAGHALPAQAVDGLRELFLGVDAAVVSIPHRGGRLVVAWAPRPCVPPPALFTVEIEQEGGRPCGT